jgi:hypothetical protein
MTKKRVEVTKKGCEMKYWQFFKALNVAAS